VLDIKRLYFILAIFFVFNFTCSARAVTRRVPTGYPTIQAAINDSNDGDIVVVEPDTYTGQGNRNIEFFGKAITVRSIDPNDPNIVATTIIDCNASDAVPGRGFYFRNNEDANSVLAGLTITGGYESTGAGIWCDAASPTIRGCIIRLNTARDGGGIYCRDSNSTITKCNITFNTASTHYGGGIYCNGGSPKITKCTISGNSALRDGGGIFCFKSNPTISNCTITANYAGRNGAAVYCSSAYPMVTNCNITGNSAGRSGGALYGCNLPITNCIVWANRPADSSLYESCVPLYSCLQDAGYGTGCISADPCFLTAGQWDDNGTPADANDDLWVDGDYHLRAESPCIDAGNYAYFTPLPETDADDNCRLTGSQIDMGPFEFGSVTDKDGDWLIDSNEPGYADDPDRDDDGILDGLEILCGTDPNVSDPSGQWNVPADVNTIQQALFFSRPYETIVLSEATYYENIYTRGHNVILTGSNPNDPNVIAATVLNGNTDADPNTANGRVITLAPIEEPNCQIRGLTITAGCDTSGAGVYGAGSNAAITFCTIIANTSQQDGGGLQDCQGAIANCNITGNYAGSCGGGLHNCNGTIVNCSIADNSAASKGGGLSDCDGLITNCTVSGNSAEFGGGLHTCQGLITNCSIKDNSAQNDGGGLRFCSGTIRGCTIYHNSTQTEGGGLYGCAGLITNCIVSGNYAALNGGALQWCNGTVANCIIIGNSAGLTGGGLKWCRAAITNCIFANNTKHAIYEGPSTMYPAVSYCLFYNNPDGDWYDLNTASTKTGADVINALPETTAIIDSDPCFVSPGYLTDANDPNTWVDGDYHLKSNGWRWNSNTKKWTRDNATSRCIDAGNPGMSLADEPITVPDDPNNEEGENLRINIGAYGGTSQASMPPYDWALLADVTNDGTVDFIDFADFASVFAEHGNNLPADFNRDGSVDLEDLFSLTGDWLKQTSWW